MQIIKGEYNQANVMIDILDDETRKQIQGFCNNPSFRGTYIAIMPDCHKGSGSCIGFTMQMNDRVIPEIVGVDIGCGMLSANFSDSSFDAKSFDEMIHQKIPSGFQFHKNAASLDENFRDVARKIGIDMARFEGSIGTLGGGNHFIEAGYDSKRNIWATIHSGSRNFGLQVARYHTDVAKKMCEKWGAETRGIPFLLVDSNEGQSYLNDMRIAQEYAKLNRFAMMEEIKSFFKAEPTEVIESVHNFIDETGMIRKGATSAHLGQKVILPFNMRDGLAICVGKGSKLYNNSSPHGAGRILSRSKAKEQLDVGLFVEEMASAGVYTTSANKDTLDEAPDAYKDKQVIIDNIKETVDILDFVKPVYNFKAGKE